MSKKRLFQVLDEMNIHDAQNQTKLVSMHPTVLAIDKVKMGTKVTVGVQEGIIDIIDQLSDNPKLKIFLVVYDADAYAVRADADFEDSNAVKAAKWDELDKDFSKK